MLSTIEELNGPIAPICVRSFDAVEIANGNWTYRLNRKRLETAIALFELWNLQPNRSIVALMYDEYPDLTPTQVQNYLVAAHACFIHQVTP